MRVVMVHDCAYVGYELRKELIKRGFEVEHVFFTTSRLPKVTTLKMAIKLRRMKCDLIHAHFCRSPAYAAYLSGKPYMIHCHGSDIRGGLSWLQKKCLKKARKVLVSTPDLLEVLPIATWLPNPVDMERFKPLKEHSGNQILYFPHWYEDISRELKKICEEIGYDLTIPSAYSIPYEEMHLFLNEFDIFVDRFSIKSYSKTALEAMACGIPVIGYENTFKNALRKLISQNERRKLVKWQNEHILPQHRVEAVTDQLIRIYGELP
ncbi:MAG: hypothetical protein QXX08_04330 [Candidatus Bathyarchaeia archaeon]